jgi:hypothetical protein
MGMLLLRHAEWVFHLGMNNHNAALSDGIGGALWLPFYCLRRDATALGLLLLSMLDITSSFH